MDLPGPRGKAIQSFLPPSLMVNRQPLQAVGESPTKFRGTGSLRAVRLGLGVNNSPASSPASPVSKHRNAGRGVRQIKASNSAKELPSPFHIGLKSTRGRLQPVLGGHARDEAPADATMRDATLPGLQPLALTTMPMPIHNHAFSRIPVPRRAPHAHTLPIVRSSSGSRGGSSNGSDHGATSRTVSFAADDSLNATRRRSVSFAPVPAPAAEPLPLPPSPPPAILQPSIDDDGEVMSWSNFAPAEAPAADEPPQPPPTPPPGPMSESELAEGAYLSAEALQLDLTDPMSFQRAEDEIRDVQSGFVPPPNYDVVMVKRFLKAIKLAAAERGVPPIDLWRALDNLERE